MFDHCFYFNAAALARLVERAWTDASAAIAGALRGRVGPELFESTIAGMHGVRTALR
ncbi:MAG: hypothetical protein ACRYGL_14690 [Janthinobacterium lividum]